MSLQAIDLPENAAFRPVGLWRASVVVGICPDCGYYGFPLCPGPYYPESMYEAGEASPISTAKQVIPGQL